MRRRLGRNDIWSRAQGRSWMPILVHPDVKCVTLLIPRYLCSEANMLNPFRMILKVLCCLISVVFANPIGFVQTNIASEWQYRFQPGQCMGYGSQRDIGVLAGGEWHWDLGAL